MGIVWLTKLNTCGKHKRASLKSELWAQGFPIIAQTPIIPIQTQTGFDPGFFGILWVIPTITRHVINRENRTKTLPANCSIVSSFMR